MWSSVGMHRHAPATTVVRARGRIPVATAHTHARVCPPVAAHERHAQAHGSIVGVLNVGFGIIQDLDYFFRVVGKELCLC